ncbi:helix-turn-helix transcriptional regulator [Clostridium sp. YIM B02505]|uniref:Helix-turn-helix transcriptional regulator n=1 Tax=Clostridium yunnanense TaxID=2800325 RepID=A0ABS1EQE0_9CLOT|nr:helix-turn-helix transcriptional regulator [Clostridium yunnanense]MBK1811564.1 helix-turn-helix transcriptional regulator [Clostridium yunnanense]
MNKYNSELKYLRTKFGYSQKHMADIIGTTPATYNRKENGLRNFTVSEAIAIATIFNEAIEKIFCNEVTKNATKS